MTLVLWDIDGTLISSGRAGVRGMNKSFERLYGLTGALDAVTVAGRTDRAIVTEVLTREGLVADDEAIARLRDAYCEDLPVALADPNLKAAGVLPGVLSWLDQLDQRSDVAVGLLTGNFVRGATIKLGHFGLWDRFTFGAFGDHHTNRRDLIGVAIDAAITAGHPRFAPDQIVVIGDTPLDVDCAHANGARAIAVATGIHTHELLVGTGAAHVVRSLDELRIEDVLGA